MYANGIFDKALIPLGALLVAIVNTILDFSKASLKQGKALRAENGNKFVDIYVLEKKQKIKSFQVMLFNALAIIKVFLIFS